MCDALQSFFLNPHYTQLMQILTSITIGIIFGPFTNSLMLYTVYLIAYEVLYLFVSQARWPWYSIKFRTVVVCAGILGFIIGRTFAWREKNPLRT